MAWNKCGFSFIGIVKDKALLLNKN